MQPTQMQPAMMQPMYEAQPPQKPWYTKMRVIIPIALVVGIIGLGAIFGGGEKDSAAPKSAATASATESQEPAPKSTPEESADEATQESAKEPEEEPAETKAAPKAPKMTVSQEQAVRKAEDYLDLASFSRSGLIDQLEFEGFTRKQAEHGAKSVGL